MKFTRGLAVVLGLLCFISLRASAQGVLPPPPRGFGPTPFGFGAGFSRSPSHGHVSLFLSSSYRLGYGGPFLYYPVRGQSITVFSYYSPAPVIVLRMPPRDIEDEEPEPAPPPRRRIAPPPKPMEEDLFDPAPKPVPKPKPPMEPQPAPAPDPFGKRPLDLFLDNIPRPAHPKADPKDECARLTDLGKEVFADEQFGRASERFRQAIAISPQEPLAHFLLGQALFALGKYEEAVESLNAGLRLQPDWPTSTFQTRPLYGNHADGLMDQTQHLRDLLARRPNDPVLLFLTAYQLWFDGHRDEASPLFKKALAAGAEKASVEFFLQVRP